MRKLPCPYGTDWRQIGNFSQIPYIQLVIYYNFQKPQRTSFGDIIKKKERAVHKSTTLTL